MSFQIYQIVINPFFLLTTPSLIGTFELDSTHGVSLGSKLVGGNKDKKQYTNSVFQTLSVTQFSRDYQKRNLHVSFYTMLKRLRWEWDHSFFSFTLHFCKFHVRILLKYKLNRLRPIIIGYLYNIHCLPINKTDPYTLLHTV